MPVLTYSKHRFNNIKSTKMEKKETKIEAIRGVFKALDKSIAKDGILLSQVRFKRDEQGNCTEILLSYEEQTEEDNG